MTPQQLSSKDTESGHQVALFAWCAVARLHGFEAANSDSSYSAPGWQGESIPEPALKWIHSIPNGGLRNAATAARMKAEGVKRGVFDIFLPYTTLDYAGLYIELKKPGKYHISAEQKEFLEYANSVNYLAVICIGWHEAAKTICRYLRYKHV